MRHKCHKKITQKGLIKGLINAVIKNGKIKTTLQRAKSVKPFVEKLVTAAKKAIANNSLALHRLIRAKVNEETYNELVKKIAPKYTETNGGYMRVIKDSMPRKGDFSRQAYLEFTYLRNSNTPKERNVER